MKLTSSERIRIGLITSALAGIFVFIGYVRLSGLEESFLSPLSGLATPLYIAATILSLVLLRRAGVDLRSFGFAQRLNGFHILLALAAVLFLQLGGAILEPLLIQWFGEGRDFSRFSGLEGSLPTLISLLALSWTFAAFGEELAYRIALMRGFATALGDSRVAAITAIVIQAIIFGLVHVYQGPAGIVGSTFSGLVFGTITYLSRGSIWPAALAHGLNNTIGLVGLYLGAG